MKARTPRVIPISYEHSVRDSAISHRVLGAFRTQPSRDRGEDAAPPRLDRRAAHARRDGGISSTIARAASPTMMAATTNKVVTPLDADSFAPTLFSISTSRPPNSMPRGAARAVAQGRSTTGWSPRSLRDLEQRGPLLRGGFHGERRCVQGALPSRFQRPLLHALTRPDQPIHAVTCQHRHKMRREIDRYIKRT